MSGSIILLEIGTEEIPARFLPPAISDLQKIVSTLLVEYRIDHGDIRTFATPRRISLIVQGIAPVQGDISKEVFGPSRNIAFDEKGNPTQAGHGFAKSLGIKPSELIFRQKGKGEYVVAVLEEKGKETKILLPEILKKTILSLRFPKSMRWGSGSMTFARPIHWILAMCDAEIISFDIDGIQSSTMTRGHRFLSPASFQLREISSYVNLLENNFVVLDQNKRRNSIKAGIQHLFDGSENRPILDEELLDTVNYLVEYPVPVLCSFSHEYLALPKELLITVMRDHQKYFGVTDPAGNLANKFIVVSNTKHENADTVRVGAERVIKARFDDAKFYYREDSEKPLSARIEMLKGVTFHDKLGSLFDKTQRISAIARFLAHYLIPEKQEMIIRAAELSKTDLTTGVVREFPELQGTMGKYYALHDGEDAEVASAIEEQYLPGNFGGALPETDAGAVASLADKTDNIASFFSIDLIPSGSEDPFALRRQAMGIASILLGKGYSLSLRTLFGETISHVPARKAGGENLLDTILQFMEQRLEYIFGTMGYSQDLIRSVIQIALSQPLNAIPPRIDALKSFRDDDTFPEFLLAIKRVYNILPKTEMPSFSKDLLVEDEEKKLHDHFSRLLGTCQSLLQEGRYHECMKCFSGITPSVNAFFDKVLVMDKRVEIRQNRFSLLREIWTFASSLADFSKLL